ncbi:hypothetical protein FO519_009348 [Halicephalobus sp. NKZ332]|nr:hypothetical protein FO519_009348 [Halicephalobus sp. NKZ332]
MTTLSTLNDIKTCSMNEDCTVILKVMRYCPTEECNKLFINCKTGDNKVIVCSGDFALHTPGTNVNEGDFIELKNVKRSMYVRNNTSELQLKIHGNSTVTIIDPDNNSKKQIIPQLPSSFPDPPRRSRQSSGIPSSISILVENPKIIGMIQKELTSEVIMGDDPDYKQGVYVTTLRLSNGDQIRLIISKKFGNWPEKLLHEGETISVIGEKTKYYDMDAIFVRPGDQLDIVSDNLSLPEVPRIRILHLRSPSFYDPVQIPLEKEKVVGMLLNDFQFKDNIGGNSDHNYEVYVAKILVYSGKILELMVLKGSINVLKYFHRNNFVSVIGQKITYDGKEAVFVRPGDHLVAASDKELALARDESEAAMSNF